MNLLKIKIISLINIFILSFICHFMYEKFPNFLFSIIFPVNESIWEHMKILFTSVMLSSILEIILLKKNNISANNYIFSLFVEGIMSIIIFLVIFLPVYGIIGENFVVTILIMLITYIISSFISYKIMIANNYPSLNKISIFLIILVYIIFAILTFYPIHTPLFYDTLNNYYGIKKN